MIFKEDPQLDFADVLIAPQTTTANHRGDIDIVRDFKSLNLRGVPVMSANMTQMGNFKTAKVLLDEGCFATLHKFYTANDIIAWLNRDFQGKIPANLFFTIGLRHKEDEIDKLKDIRFFIEDKAEWEAHDGSGMNILIDVPNAYIPAIEDYVKEVRHEFPKAVIAVGNVSSGDQTQKLIRGGANIVKVGIGPSCFPAGTLVVCTGLQDGVQKDKYKPIETITDDDLIYGYNEKRQTIVLHHAVCIDQGFKHTIKLITDTGDIYECTEDHKFYSEGQWVEAKDMLGKSIMTLHNSIYHDFEHKVTVVEIKKGRNQHVYDLSVVNDDNPNFFVTNGTTDALVHNCVCDTRIKTGCGRPQLSAIIECANAAHQVGGYIIADGGFKQPADICKALVAGADFCMSGSFFAGTDEANGEIITKYKTTNELKPVKTIDPHTGPFIRYEPIIVEEKFKEYYGMSSFRAQQENYGTKTKTGTSEGVECKLVPYIGSVKTVIDDIKGSIRSCGSYIGALKVKNFARQGMFYKVQRIK